MSRDLDDLDDLATAAASGTVRELVALAAALTDGAWMGHAHGWTPVGPTQVEVPPPDATTVQVEGHRVALAGSSRIVESMLRAGLARVAAEDGRRAARSRLDLNERIAGLGSYDWNIVTDVNEWSDELYRIYGYHPGEIEMGYERFIEHVHPDDRDRIRELHERAYATGEPYEMEEHIVRPDGSVRTLWSNGAVIRDADGTPVRMVGVCRDITQEREVERRAAAQHDRIHSAELLRKQALELNDRVVQGLTVVVWAVDDEAMATASRVAQETLAHARTMMHELLSASDEPTEPGSLVRESGVDVGVVPTDPAARSAPPSPQPCRVVLADDAADLRLMLRIGLEMEPDITVVGEAEDGVEAVELVARTRPDVVLLDLSMPRMDGLEASARIRAENPDMRIVVLSGWGEATMGAEAGRAGADAYVEKGASISTILDLVREGQERVA